MYRVYCDDALLYDSRLSGLRIFNASVELEVNRTGSFVFTMYPDHPYYGRLRKLRSIITVYQKDAVLFRGRVLDEETGWHNEKRITCEGELAFLLDTIQRPEAFSGTAAEYITRVIQRHDQQAAQQMRFTPGRLTVDGLVDIVEDEYTNSLEALQKRILDVFGGYLHIRHEDGTQYIDYLSDFTLLSPQKIQFGKNLMDLKRMRNGDDIVTALIPLGAKLEGTEQRLTVESVNEGSDMIMDDDAAVQYGFICKTQVFDKITDAAELLRTGKAHLASLVNLPETIELTAADLATVSTDFDSFHVGTYVTVESKPHGISQRFLITKMSIDLLSPAANKLTLGGTIEPMTMKTAGIVPVRDGKDGKNGEDATVMRIDSSRGTVFKNNTVSTTLTVTIYHGENRITDKEALTEQFGSNARLEWSWQRIGESTYGVISADDSRLHDDGFSLVLTPSDVDTKATFMCKLIL